jgi:hypothetical protein
MYLYKCYFYKLNKHFLRKSIVIFILVGISSLAIGQEQKETIFDEATIVYKKAVFGGVIAHTQGWGAHLSFGKNKTAFKSRIIQFDVVNMRHPKEIRTVNAFFEDGRSFVFGKVNSFFILRPTIGQRYIKFDRIRPSGVGVGYSWRVGPSIGFTKPVYLEIISPDNSPLFSVIVERYDPIKHEIQDIYGRAGGLRGFGEMQIQPGLHGAFAFNFEYDAKREGLKGIEVGATMDFFPGGPVEIMAFADNQQLFFNFYINLQFGSKFND